MKFYVCSLLASAAIAMPAFAAPTSVVAEEQDNSSEVALAFSEGTLFNPLAAPDVCKTVNLDDTQKASLKQAYYEFAKQKNTLSAEVKNAMLDVLHTFMDTASTKDDANNSLTAAKTAMGNLGDAVGTLQVKIFYDILKPEQREPAFKCAMAWAKMKKAQKLKEICAGMGQPKPPQKPNSNPAP
ncbi:hypothetical protein [Bdellovibrio sp. NC01]|uniref:hypothetical protein n=1 Tax=Bdellovibrio sp. NC01 TaxID=2220073 RepID=UPI00115BBAA5|nr:hypothetical protein [Bdellovibrio sp. NC01]QDK36707.1 hypothetical protein DOE51_03365 [Bdellovibrio sp. NC01]